ncbi:hypothetical protein [Salmonirosea aquatica]|uniref:Uncharacterized protein n=1 Tax=Salmonirosea aquatica TaxID=2654236 RepID=A0A7C9BM99_9BACT|nr:hypothetical protein [Cytophagaceae bacterium SJW1-29]
MGNTKKSGRPFLKEEEKRRKVTLMLSPIEIDSLKKEYEGHTVGFSVFCREKLLNREAATLRKPLEPGIQRQLTNLLKLSGSLLLLSRKTSSQLPISEDFEQMAENVKEVVQRTLYTVNEIAYSQSLIMELNSIALDLEKTLQDVADAQAEGESLKSALKRADDLKKAMEPFLKLYKLKKMRHDR